MLSSNSSLLFAPVIKPVLIASNASSELILKVSIKVLEALNTSLKSWSKVNAVALIPAAAFSPSSSTNPSVSLTAFNCTLNSLVRSFKASTPAATAPIAAPATAN